MIRRLLTVLPVVLVLGACAAPGTTPQTWPGPPSVSPVPGLVSPTVLPTCPPSGVRMRFTDGDAAMGLRVVGLTLTNCGARDYRVSGYPVLRPLDADRAVLDVTVLPGVTEISSGLEQLDFPDREVVLAPGQAASAVVAWRNTYDDTTHGPVNVDSVSVSPQEGRPFQTVTPDHPFDLGSTGRLGVTRWEADSTSPSS
ncbi:DUF4232 domain-containing protein [Actinoplanes sp. NBRC 101535]|uniref:DUF4232 domain-containing protein n=1 Tax=Actinoplanes sp. NBRC 101535 TaxID=3032196 RepID=UPI0024A4C18E|nr:DUF4232 domain-containing protein [Actinoplanes sp. NBRC 101535]GLY05313.1 hypothetical protein Acsp01_56920 [Actinoplanes sp. NBRC 101535]